MKTVKIVSIITSTAIFLLIALALNLEDPLKANYRKTIEKMMETESMKSENEVLAKYPALNGAKEQIAQADQIKIQICSKTSGPVPSSTKAGEKELQKMQNELIELRQNAERLLKNIHSNNAVAATP